ncbi:MAG TPA: metal ABC transporter permease [bacterium]|nr:metal ABC transporter permease [bacterium]
MAAFDFLFVGFLACLVLVGIHGYLGIHVLARGVIFVDIALAQIAALGSTVAFLRGNPLDSGTAWAYSVGFTFAAAALFALSRNLRERVPQEAIIGVAYATCAALTLMLVEMAPNGAQHIKDLLVGSIDFVTLEHVRNTAIVYGLIGAFQYAFRKKFITLSFDHDAPEAKTRSAMLWDLAFYMSFGLVITMSVQVAGVLLVFCFLIVPSVFAAMFAEKISTRLAIAWTLGFVVSALGIFFAYESKNWLPQTEGLPTGPTVVATFGAALLLAFAVRRIFRRWLGGQVVRA